ncbi:MAG: polysaccharide biosynthesis/export family protein [Hyphomicrobium sp.]|nr:polysaccharide biosynthesis/export family protein [Hyphomicrobium sp.]
MMLKWMGYLRIGNTLAAVAAALSFSVISVNIGSAQEAAPPVPDLRAQASSKGPSDQLSVPAYRLGPLDKIRIKVFSWRASQDQIFEWTAINKNEDYTVGPSGDVSIPLIGEFRAADRTTAELAKEVGLALQDRIGMVETPDVAIEVSQFRPFYITGDVQKAGEYPYRPDLTVIQAVAIAGGPMRDPRSSNIRLEREIIAGEGELAVLLKERTQLLVRRARLESELNNSKDIVLPEELAIRRSDDDVRLFLQQEEQIFKARLDGHSTQMQALEQLRAFFETELSSTDAQVQAQQTEVAAVERELAQVKTLAEKKLTTETRLFALQRNRAQVEGERLRMQSALARVKQDLSKTEISIIELANKRTAEVTADLSTNAARLSAVEQQIITARKLLAESEVMGSPPFLGLSQQKYEIAYKVIRKSGADTVELSANDTMVVQPGDTVRVDIIRAANISVGRVSPSAGQ